MRILVRDVTDNGLCLYSISDAMILTEIEQGFYSYSVGSAIKFSDEHDNNIYLVLPLATCESILRYLMRDGYIDISMYANETLIFPDRTDLPRLKKLCKETETSSVSC